MDEDHLDKILCAGSVLKPLGIDSLGALAFITDLSQSRVRKELASINVTPVVDRAWQKKLLTALFNKEITVDEF